MSDSFVTPWTIACQTPLFKGFARHLLFPSPGDHPDPGIELVSSALHVDSLLLSHQGNPSFYLLLLLLLLLSRFSRVRLCATP